jgi:Tol biopolymer transport system component
MRWALAGVMVLAWLAGAPAEAAPGTVRVSVASDGAQATGGSYHPAISDDGWVVAFASSAANLVAGDRNGADDIFVHDGWTGKTTRVSVASDGTEADGASSSPTLSGNGRFVAFMSSADNLVPGDTNGEPDVFVHDRRTGQTTRVSVASDGSQPAPGSYQTLVADITPDGRFVSFTSRAANLVAGDTNGAFDVFVHDRWEHETTRVSVGPGGAQGDGDSRGGSMSDDGRFVAFSSAATKLVPGRRVISDVYVYDRRTGETTRASIRSDGTPARGNSDEAVISGNGRFVAFRSGAHDLAPHDTDWWDQIFVHDRATGETTRVSESTDGAQPDDASWLGDISGDGRFVAFQSYATNLVAGDTNGANGPSYGFDVFVRDRQHGTTTRVSVASDGAQADAPSFSGSLSADGRVVVFASGATNLVPGDTNGDADIFVRMSRPW